MKLLTCLLLIAQSRCNAHPDIQPPEKHIVRVDLQTEAEQGWQGCMGKITYWNTLVT